MTFLEKQKVKSRLTIVVFAMFGLFIGWISDANALSSYFESSANGGEGCKDAGCHDGPAVTPTCNGCHAHGTHIDSGKLGINISASTDATSYNLGDTIAITVKGGYRANATNWSRVTIYDADGDVLAQSKGICDDTTSTVTNVPPACANGSPMNRDGASIVLQVVAPNQTGTHKWTASWFGNKFDPTAGGGTFGSPTTSVTVPGWMEDTAIGGPNSTHGQEIVAVNEFTVNDAPPASSGGGGGSLSWPVLGLLLFVVTGMLLRGRQANLISVKQCKID